MAGDGITTLQRPSRLTGTLLRTFRSFDADNSSTINLDGLKMAASFDEQRRQLSEGFLRRWPHQHWFRPDPSTAHGHDVVTRLDLNGDGEVDVSEFDQ